MNLTAHMLVYNEEKWLLYAITSVLPFVEKLIIFDTGSTDETVGIIKSLNDAKITFEKKGRVDKKQMTALRNEQLARTETDWFMIADGDEVYPKRIFDKLDLGGKSDGIYLRNHVCVGDVFHRLPEFYGKYEFCGKRGHLNLRYLRKMAGWQWCGEYPREYYGAKNGQSINKMCDKLQFIDDYYWHLSFLERSSASNRNHVKYHLGEKIKGQLPEVFRGEALRQRSINYIARSFIETPVRWMKRQVQNS